MEQEKYARKVLGNVSAAGITGKVLKEALPLRIRESNGRAGEI